MVEQTELMLRDRLQHGTAQDARMAIRSGDWKGTTHGLAPGQVQANLAILPEAYALDFMRFCQRNPKPCPLIDATDTGDPEFRQVAPGSDVRRDLSGYCVYRDGVLDHETDDIATLWRDDLVAFAMGCSLSFDQVLLDHGLDVAHRKRPGGRIAVYTSDIQCVSAGPFQGPMVVSLRPIPRTQLNRVIEVTSRYPATHGSPIHVGSPAEIGIHDTEAVDWGKAPILAPGDEAVFWGCGVTPQAVAMKAKIPFMITHKTGHMLLTDLSMKDIAR